MNKAVPWRIKGVGFDARAAAIEAARRSGMSLGEWLNTVIAEQAEDDGVETEQLDADDRLDAVTRRLSSLRDGPDTTEHHDARGSKKRPVERNRRERETFDDRDAQSDEHSRPQFPQPESFRQEVDAERLLENAIAAFDRRANRSSERTARALAEVADLIDANHRDRGRDDKALATIADRLSHIEQRVARESAPQPDPSIHDALARLERRIEKLAQRPAASPREAPPPREAAAPARPQPAQSQPQSRRPLAAAIAEVARRQQELDGHSGHFSGQVAGNVSGSVPSFVPSAPPASVVRPPAAMPSPLEARLSALVERLEKSALRKEEPVRAPDISGLQGNIDALTDRIEKMRGDIAARNAVPPARDNDQIAEIRRELAGMARAVTELAPRASVSSLEGAVRELSARIIDSRIDGVGEAALAPVEGLMRELLGVVRSADPRGAIESLDRGIRVVAAKLESFDGAAVADPELARGIAEQTREMRDTLARIHDNQLPTERIERSLADLAARVETIASSGADPLGRGEMAQRVGEIRAMLSDPLVQEQTLQTIERRLEAIASRVDSVFDERLDSMQRRLAAEFDRARADTMPSVDTLVHDLGARIDAALTGGFKAMEKTVARLVETTPARPDPSASRLEEMVRNLAARVEAGTAPGAGPDALEAVNQQIARLAEHFDRNDRTAETLVGLQHSIADLFTRLEDHRVGDSSGPSPEVSRELADLRSLQDAADHRTHATLTAVHDTLSQVVNRLSSLEDDLADVREGTTQPAHETPAPPLSSRMDAIRATRFDRQPAESALEEGIEPDVLIEPGAAFDRRLTGSDADALSSRPQASFIQAARRAAQAASVSDGGADAPARRTRVKADSSTPESKSAAPLDQVRAYYASRKRPILLSLAALMMIFGAWQIARVMNDDRAPPPAPPAVQTPKTSSLPVREKMAERPVSPIQSAQNAPAEAMNVPPAASSPRAEPAPPPAEAAAPPPSTQSASIDRVPVGTIGRPEAPVDTNGIVRAFAVSGDAAAQYELAMRYADGRLLARDLKLSKEWFEKAAAKGIVPAQYRLGAMYERGIGVPKDPAQAKSWYQRAADAGNARAMHNLAVLYADASAGKPDYANAIIWFRRAAEFGIRDSQFNLAILYARGLGTPVNMVEAYIWFAAAAAQGDEDAAKKREDVAMRLQQNDLSRAKALAASLKPKPLDAAANEVSPPPGGWESMKPPPRPDAKSTARPKITGL